MQAPQSGNHPVSRSARQSNIELLRCLAMFLIVTFHCAYKSGFTFDALDPSTFSIKMFWMAGELGVDLFMLITGYFMVTGRFKMNKLILLLGQILFYYLLTTGLACLLDGKTIDDARQAFLLFFPALFNRYWYATAYVLIYLLSPWLNRLVHAMDQRSYVALMLTGLLIWCVTPTFFGMFEGSTEALLHYNRFIWFVILYFVGGYLRLYPVKFFESAKRCALLVAAGLVVMALSIVLIATFNDGFAAVGLTEWAYFRTPNNLPMLCVSLGVFGLFLRMNIGSIPVVNKMASATLGIYLLHEGPLQNWLWFTVFQVAQWQSSIWLLAYFLFTALVVYFAGTIIDLGRQVLEKFTLDRFLKSDRWTHFSKKVHTGANDAIDRWIARQ